MLISLTLITLLSFLNLSHSLTVPGLIIPLYIYPNITGLVCDDANYVKVGAAAVAGKSTIAIVNPNNGPGTA